MKLECIKTCTLVDGDTNEEVGVCFTKYKIYNVDNRFGRNGNILSIIDDNNEFHTVYRDDNFFKEHFKENLE